jgi:D-alanine--poly(phosphoribitol) ligase subunit 1
LYNINFIKRCFKNLESKNIFYKYFNERKTYRDLKRYYLKFKSLIKSERLKIVTFSDKTFEMYASVVSIFFSNNIWVPLSSSLPTERLIEILKNSKINIILIENTSKLLNDKKLKKFIKFSKIKIISYSEINNHKADKDNFEIPKFDFHSMSMIYFTSGSTGSPKGVCITYNNFISCFKSKNEILYKNKKKLIFGDYHDPSFVISLVILFPCIYLGSIISPSRNLYETLNPIAHLKKNKINVLITVPSTINRVKELYPSKFPIKNLRILVMCGEPFRLTLAKYIFDIIKPKKLFNFYGSTEVSPWIFFHKCHSKDIDNFSKFDLMPVGIPLNKIKSKIKNNELLVAGPVLSPGYLDSSHDKNVFFKARGTRWYRTKDQVEVYKKKYFIKGRIDKVVKIQGYRVDLGDIENNLRKLKKVNEALAYLKIVKNKKVLSCVVETRCHLKKIEIIKQLSNKIPNYMIPQRIAIYKKLPLNRSGKVDRKKIMI